MDVANGVLGRLALAVLGVAMLHHGNIACGALATPPAAGQASESEVRAGSPPETASLTSLSPAEITGAFSEAARLLRSVDPDFTDLQDPPGTTSARVALRLNGRFIAHATAQPEPETSALQNASAAARLIAERAIGAEASAWAGSLSVDIEFGGALRPAIARNWAELTPFASPGVHGVAVELGTGASLRRSTLMPADQIRFGLGGVGVWRRVCTQAGLAIGTLDQVIGPTGARLYAFDTYRIIQETPSGPVRFLTRGDRPVALASITTPNLRADADAMARFLIALRWTGEQRLGMGGDVLLGPGRTEPVVAPLREQMVAAFALARYARTDGIDAAQSSTALRAAQGVLSDALDVEVGEQLFLEDPIAAAAWIVAATELARSRPLPEKLSAAMPDVAALLMVAATDEMGARVEAGEAAIIALALVRHANEQPDESPARANQRALASTLARTLLADRRGALRDAMPWLGWAVLESTAPNEPIPGGELFRAFRAEMGARRASVELLGPAEADLSGGFIGERVGRARPTYESLRSAAFFATMLGDQRLTPAEQRVIELDGVRRSARFARRLMLDSEDLWRTPIGRSGVAGTPVVGGVRREAWSDTAAVDATALALLTLCETLDGVSRAFAPQPVSEEPSAGNTH